ncbi:MAG: hypothetical protein ACJAWO_002221 [Halieaceae bacterium]|jgi:hypothetical protein
MNHFVITNLWVVLLAGFSFNGISQQLNTVHSPTLKSYPFFNGDFIKAEEVKSIHTMVMYKMPNRRIRNSQVSQKFNFDRRGNVYECQEILVSGMKIKTSFFLNKTGLLATIHLENSYKDELKTFFYNEQGFVTRIESADGKNGKMLLEEKFKYEYFSGGQYKKYYLNDEGLTYKYEVVDVDSSGRIIETRSRNIRGVNREYATFKYDQKVLVMLSVNTKNVTRREERYEMDYDRDWKLQTANYLVDAAPVYRYEYLYENGVIIAILRKNLQTQEIQITKLKYTFY